MYTMGYFSIMRKEDIFPLVTMWMDLEHIMLSEIRQRKISILYDITYM